MNEGLIVNETYQLNNIGFEALPDELHCFGLLLFFSQLNQHWMFQQGDASYDTSSVQEQLAITSTIISLCLSASDCQTF